MTINTDPIGAPQLARSLGLPAKNFRHLLRTHKLVPTHRHAERYELSAEEVRHIEDHWAIKQAQANRSAAFK